MHQQQVLVLPGNASNLEAVVGLLRQHGGQDYFAYEREDVWHIGIGNRASLSIDSTGEFATTTKLGQQAKDAINGSLSEEARRFVGKFSQHNGKIFGWVGFNYGAHIRGLDYRVGTWPLLSIMVPTTQVTLSKKEIVVRSYNKFHLNEIGKLLSRFSTEVGEIVDFRQPQPIDTQHDDDTYKERVAKAVSEIQAGLYTKVILSRAIDLGGRVDMLTTLLHGRRANTPARTFTFSHDDFQATGFSPELVVSVHDDQVTTEPLAGTRACKGTEDEIAVLEKTLIEDVKEIAEHVLSVKEAIRELDRISQQGSVSVKELMCVRQRGSVQHLASTVTGQLALNKDAWEALDVLFPSITASGIPKDTALQVINRLEDRPRELYSGAVMILDNNESLFEATLCLRTVFQDSNHQWTQAGAGIIAQSKPERELEETKEKLASVAPFVVFDSSSDL